MRTVMHMEPMKRRQPSQQLLNELANTIGHRQIPPASLNIDSTVVHIADFAAPIARFTEQLHELAALNLTWPCARFVQRDLFAEDERVAEPPFVERWVPLDLTDSIDPNIYAELSLVAAEIRAADLGLDLKRRPLLDVFNSFCARIGEDIMSRWRVATDRPPTGFQADDPVEVTTDSDNLDVLFSIGPFLSTQQGFGQSSPARRRLRPGSYCFGVATPGCEPWFSETIWNVPETKNLHLSK